MKRKNPLALLTAWLGLSLLQPELAHGADAAIGALGVGTVSGRVRDVVTGKYLNNARVSVQGTPLLTFTDGAGTYLLPNVPAGPHRLEVFFTGLDKLEIPVEISPGQTHRHDADLTSVSRYGDPAQRVRLESFVVQAARETNVESIAINEQRFSPNLKSVISTETIGDPMGGSMGDFLRFLPGVSSDHAALETEGVLIRGFPSNMTVVSVDGSQMAGAALGGGRAFTPSRVGVNSISRVEVTKVPLPSTPADTMSGSLNLVSKSAFERSGAEFKYRVGITTDDQRFALKRTPAPSNKKTWTLYPELDFDYTLPITRNLGIVVTGLHSKISHETDTILFDYRASGTGTGATPANPYPWRIRNTEVSRTYERDSLSFKVDWRPLPHSTVSVGYTFGYYEAFNWNKSLNPTVGNVGTPTPASGVGLSYNDTNVYGATGRGSVAMSHSFQHIQGANHVGNLRYRFDNGVWRIDGSGSLSISKAWRRYVSSGFFNDASVGLKMPVRVNYIGYGPGKIPAVEIFDNNNQPVDMFDINNYAVSTATEGAPEDVRAEIRSFNLDVRRQLPVLPFPANVQFGGLYRERTNDATRYPQSWTYNGPGGDRSAAPYLADVYYGERKLGYYRDQPYPPWVSLHKLRDALVSHPGYFSQTLAQQYNTTRDRILNSKEITEEAGAYYLQGEMRLLRNRLTVLGGMRYEKTKNQASGPLTDITGVYARTADGSILRNAAGQPVRRADIGPAGSLAEIGLIYQERAARARQSYDGYYPSLHINYNVTPNFMVRAAYAQTYGRPDFANIIPNTAVDSDDSDTSDPDAARGRIRVSNINLQPWTANNYDLSLEYYTDQGGVFSAGVFRKDVDGFFGQSVRIATPEDLRELSLDDRFLGWQVTTQFNSGSARITGMELAARHSLAPLGRFGRPLTLFANYTRFDREGHKQADFTGFLPKFASWGLTFSKSPVIFIAKWSYRGWNPWQLYPDLGPNATNNVHPRLQLDLNLNYQLSKRIMIYANIRNATNEPQKQSAFGPETPEHIRHSYSNYSRLGRILTLGMKGSF